MACQEFKCIAAGLILLVLACAPCSASSEQEPEVRTISSRPDSVSGGDVLVRVSAPSGSHWSVQVDGRDVTRSFQPAESSGNLLALLTGLKPGKNTLEFGINGGNKAKLEIVDHPLTGPIFSGPHQEPFICQTEENGLGPALDSDCTAKTVVQYYYKSTEAVATDLFAPAPVATSLAPGLKAYNPADPFPSDVAQTVTSEGRTVNYMVRREIGTINRAVYDIQFLHQPGQPLPTPWTHPTPGWNGRLVYFFDGGCGAGYRQGVFLGAIGAANEPFLAQGYATATSTLNRFANNCNDRVTAETLSMVKEHFIKQYGLPAHTIGWGESGGAMELHLTAQNYPGLFDGIIPYLAFPDMISWAPSVTDCSLLDQVFKDSKGHWTEDQKTAVSGLATWRTCHQLSSFIMADARDFCDRVIPKNLLYDRVANPKGVRCDVYDNEINIFGRNPQTGVARRPLDNVGVQYGLAAFNKGTIDAEQFLELNERAGGHDDDGHIVATRTEADPEALRIAYQSGLVLTGGGGLSQVPIIEWRPYTDDMADGHVRFESFATRARLIAANGNADNQVILTYPRYSTLDLVLYVSVRRFEVMYEERARGLVRQMDRWLDNIVADSAAGTPSAKVARNKPADLADSCWPIDGQKLVEPATYDGPGRCNQLYPSHADPRIAAGGPLTDDVLKCALKPIKPADYSQTLSADQLERLRAVFPGGVCDYSRPGVGQQITKVMWQKY